MDIIYLSPHLDDAALSCGGLIWHQSQAGHHIQIWTLCAGKPPGMGSDFVLQLHQRWGLVEGAVEQRRAEDVQACQQLGAAYHHFSLPDCIYRQHPETGQPLYTSEKALFGNLAAVDDASIGHWAGKLAELLPGDPLLVCPLTVGGHVDHKMTRKIVKQLQVNLAYYADYPYVSRIEIPLALIPQGYKAAIHPVSENALSCWQDSIACYASQISTFWPDEVAMRDSVREYWRKHQGIRIWEKAHSL